MIEIMYYEFIGKRRKYRVCVVVLLDIEEVKMIRNVKIF
jgi:hypothetical protein